MRLISRVGKRVRRSPAWDDGAGLISYRETVVDFFRSIDLVVSEVVNGTLQNNALSGDDGYVDERDVKTRLRLHSCVQHILTGK